MVEGLCKVWPGRMVAVICVPYIAGLGAALNSQEGMNGTSEAGLANLVSQMHQKLEIMQNGCSLDIELVVHDLDSWEDPRLALYPVNAVRNRALMLAQTEAVYLLDVDFLPSTSMTRMVEDNGEEISELLRKLNEKYIYVTPAFGHADLVPLPNGYDFRLGDLDHLLADKQNVVKAYAEKLLPSFYESENSLDHGCTNFSRWITADAPYSITYEKMFEPYVIVARKYVPWYDERFIGYFRNKVEHLEYMYGLGLQYAVHPSAYVIHRPHPKSAAAQLQGTERLADCKRMLYLHETVQKEIEDGIYNPVTSFGGTCPDFVPPSVRVPVPSQLPTYFWARDNQTIPSFLKGPCIKSSDYDEAYVHFFRVNIYSVRSSTLQFQSILQPDVLHMQHMVAQSGFQFIENLLETLRPSLCSYASQFTYVGIGASATEMDALSQKYPFFQARIVEDFGGVNRTRPDELLSLLSNEESLKRLSILSINATNREMGILESVAETLSDHQIAFLLMDVLFSPSGNQNPQILLLSKVYELGYICTILQSRKEGSDEMVLPSFSAPWISFETFTNEFVHTEQMVFATLLCF